MCVSSCWGWYGNIGWHILMLSSRCGQWPIWAPRARKYHTLCEVPVLAKCSYDTSVAISALPQVHLYDKGGSCWSWVSSAAAAIASSWEAQACTDPVASAVAIIDGSLVSLRSTLLWSWWNVNAWHIPRCHWWQEAIDIAVEKVWAIDFNPTPSCYWPESKGWSELWGVDWLQWQSWYMIIQKSLRPLSHQYTQIQKCMYQFPMEDFLKPSLAIDVGPGDVIYYRPELWCAVIDNLLDNVLVPCIG